MTQASLLLSILGEVNEVHRASSELPTTAQCEKLSAFELASLCSYKRGLKDVLNTLQEACEKAQGHALHLPEPAEAPPEEKAERLSADQYLFNDVQLPKNT